MNPQSIALAEYLRGRPDLGRFLDALLQKYLRNGGPGGSIQLLDARPEELAALTGITGKRYKHPLKIQARDFEAAFESTVYCGADMKEVLELLYHTQVRTRKEERQEKADLFEGTLREAAEKAGLSKGSQWLEGLRAPECAGRQTLQRALKENPVRASAALETVLASLRWLEEHPQTPVRLAVLSAAVTSDPHALDRSNLAGRMLVQLLAWVRGEEPPEDAEGREALFSSFWILSDSISSTVTQLGLILETPEGEHPAWQSMRRRSEAAVITPANLDVLSGARSPSGMAFCVENQMVFSQLADHAPQFHSPLICTSGQPSLAALRLLDLLAASQTQLWYSGDLDGKGLAIAAQLKDRYGDLLHLWRLSPEDYAVCASEVSLSKASQALLQGPQVQAQVPVASLVHQRNRAGYQELLLPQMLQDLCGMPPADSPAPVLCGAVSAAAANSDLGAAAGTDIPVGGRTDNPRPVPT